MRGVRHLGGAGVMFKGISILTLTRDATRAAIEAAGLTVFQSTRPRGARQVGFPWRLAS